MNKKIISGICAAAMMLGTVALADGGLTSACAKNASDIAEVKDLALVVKANSEKYGTRLYNVDQNISNLQTQIYSIDEILDIYNYRFEALEASESDFDIDYDDLKFRVGVLENHDVDCQYHMDKFNGYEDRISQLEINEGQIESFLAKDKASIDANTKSISDLTSYTESFHADYNSNMDMIYADIDNLYALLTEAQTGATVGEVSDIKSQVDYIDSNMHMLNARCDELQAQNASLQAELSNAYSQVANLQAQIDALSAYVYG